MPYFELFPKITYDIDGKRLSRYQYVTNIFFRIRILRKILENITAYYTYTVHDSDTPEILAEKIYRDPSAFWIILLANDMVDPQYDWPLDSRSFDKYIIGKYGSIENAKTQIHHYEKAIERTESLTGITTVSRFQINEDKLTENDSDVPYDYYEGLPETQEFNTWDLPNGRTVMQVDYRNAVTCYDWETMENDKKREIKIIKPEYYPQIMNEFQNLTKNNGMPYLRRLV